MAEIGEALQLLGDREVLTFSSQGKHVEIFEGYRVSVDYSMQKLADFDPELILIPGGDAAWIFMQDSWVEPLKEAFHTGKARLGGVCHGALAPIRAGLLDGQNATHICTPEYSPPDQYGELLDTARPYTSMVNYLDEDLVVSDRIVTAKPWASSQFAKELLSSKENP